MSTSFSVLINLFIPEQHNEGVGAEYTKMKKPVKLVYIERFDNLKKAIKRERQIKGWRKQKKINLIKYDHPNGSKNNN